MSRMTINPFQLSKLSSRAIEEHARATYADECCGIIVERDGREEVVRVTNVQNEMHAQDPERYPRTAQIAYSMGPEAGPILMAAERGELKLRAIYHSHPEHDAYFSAEDKAQALGGWDEPMYPDVAWLVLSVRQREVVATKAFVWSAEQQDFIEAALEIVE